MIAHLEALAARVRHAGIAADILPGSSYPLLDVRCPSGSSVRVMAGAVHYWWYGHGFHPIGPVSDPANVAGEIEHRLRAGGDRR